jgi:hypothetical protein
MAGLKSVETKKRTRLLSAEDTGIPRQAFPLMSGLFSSKGSSAITRSRDLFRGASP